MPRNKKNVYFVCHRKNQEHMLITIKRGAYVGMRTSIISKNSGGGYIITHLIGLPLKLGGIISCCDTSEMRCLLHEKLEILQSRCDTYVSTA